MAKCGWMFSDATSKKNSSGVKTYVHFKIYIPDYMWKQVKGTSKQTL